MALNGNDLNILLGNIPDVSNDPTFHKKSQSQIKLRERYYLKMAQYYIAKWNYARQIDNQSLDQMRSTVIGEMFKGHQVTPPFEKLTPMEQRMVDEMVKLRLAP